MRSVRSPAAVYCFMVASTILLPATFAESFSERVGIVSRRQVFEHVFVALPAGLNLVGRAVLILFISFQ